MIGRRRRKVHRIKVCAEDRIAVSSNDRTSRRVLIPRVLEVATQRAITQISTVDLDTSSLSSFPLGQRFVVWSLPKNLLGGVIVLRHGIFACGTFECFQPLRTAAFVEWVIVSIRRQPVKLGNPMAVIVQQDKKVVSKQSLPDMETVLL